jgi:HEAT repeat protein
VAAGPEVIAALVGLLRDPHSNVRWLAMAVGSLGPAAPPAILAALPRLLRDPDTGARQRAATVVGDLGAAAATGEVLAALPRLLRDPEKYVRFAAADALAVLARQGFRFFRRRRWLRRLKIIPHTLRELVGELPLSV